MKLQLQQLSRWQSNEKYNIALSAPMSPMLAAQDFIKKTFGEERMVLTGLFRIRNEGEPTFTIWENADIYPTQIDVICGVLNFRHLIVFGEIGSRYMPICIVLDGKAQFSELYTNYKWLLAPTVEEIAEVLGTIDFTKLQAEFEQFRWKVKAEQADDWFLGQDMQSQSTITNEKIPCEALAKWDAMPPQEKYQLYKKWNKL